MRSFTLPKRLCQGSPSVRSQPPNLHALRRGLQTSRSSSSPASQPFTRKSLDHIRSSLQPIPTWNIQNTLPPHTVPFARGKPANEAAILIPLMNIDDKPHVLMEIRASHMRTHAGEVSFPGGRVDKIDRDITHAALRETEEELSIPSENIEILGMVGSSEYSLGNRARVWPLVGFVHSSSDHHSSDNASSLSSFPLTGMHASPDEVSSILPLPLSAIQDPQRHTIHYFRLDVRKPYSKICVTDLAYPAAHTPGNEPRKGQDDLEVWGLSGWFLNVLAWRLGWLERPIPPTYED